MGGGERGEGRREGAGRGALAQPREASARQRECNLAPNSSAAAEPNPGGGGCRSQPRSRERGARSREPGAGSRQLRARRTPRARGSRRPAEPEPSPAGRLGSRAAAAWGRPRGAPRCPPPSRPAARGRSAPEPMARGPAAAAAFAFAAAAAPPAPPAPGHHASRPEPPQLRVPAARRDPGPGAR